MRFDSRAFTGALAILACAATAVRAQEVAQPLPGGYPARPIRVLVGTSPGGGLDSVTRMVTQRIGDQLRQIMVVDNRPGASSTIAMKLTKDAEPDGYTLLSVSETMILDSVLKRIHYDIFKAFAPVAQMTSQMYMLVVIPSLPVKSVKDLIAYAKQHPGAINYGSAGIGSVQHLGTAHLASMAGIKLVHVPYKGGGAALVDMLSGQIQLMFTTTIAAAPFLKTGKLKALAVSGTHRAAAYPSLPTVSEAGVPGFQLTNMYGLYAPAGTPRAIVWALNRAAVAAMSAPSMKKVLESDGIEAAPPNTPQQFTETVRDEYKHWAEFVTTQKIKL